MKFIAKFLVAALLLTGSAAGFAAPAVNPAPAATPTEAVTVAETVAELTEAEAVSAALSHAGLSEAEVTGLKARRERDDGRYVWDVDFRHEDHEYDYTIHPETGAILEWDKEYDPPRPVPTEPPATEAPAVKPPATEPPATEPPVVVPPATEPPPAQPPAAETDRLTKDEALAIALKHAGLSADQVSRIRCERDVDDGIPEWEIEFRRGEYEYDYTIHAKTGKILDWEKDRDD